MGYLYRPMLKGKESGFVPKDEDLVLSRSPNGNGSQEANARCQHPSHGREDTCPGCGARFGKVWLVKYYVNGKAVRESTGTEKETEARLFLKDREGKAVTGQMILPRVDRIRYEELAGDLRRHYETTGRRRLTEVEDRLTHLDRFFAGRRAASIAGAILTEYVAKRQGELTNRGGPTSNRTINIELALLRRMLRLAYENGKLLRVPPIKSLKEAAPRQGFFERDQYEAVRRRLSEDLRVAVTIAHTFGWRMRGEVLSLQLRQVDLEAGTIRLEPGTTKNADGRVLYVTPELNAMLKTQVGRVMNLMRERGAVIPYLFPHLTGRLQGKPRQDFRKTWATACRKAGCPGMLKHDFRRTAVRNMVNLGIPERVAMTVTGHKTRSVFDRYHIVSPADLQGVSRKLAGTFSGTFGQIALDDGGLNVRSS